MSDYPKIKINLPAVKENAEELMKKFNGEIIGVTKGVCANPRIVEAMKSAGIKKLGDSRIKNLKWLKSKFDEELMLLRIPMKSEAEEVVRFSDVSLNSEISVLERISEEAERWGKNHSVIIMVDIGDRREGVLPGNLTDIVSETKKLSNLIIKGIGTNLGCFSGKLPTKKDMKRLIELKDQIENQIRIDLSVLSGGSTVNLKLVEENNLPKEINQLRIGEAILLGKSVTQNRNIDYLNQNTMELKTEIIELKKKHSEVLGKTGQNAFGENPNLNGEGKKERAIVGIGRQDTNPKNLEPKKNGIQILGASSDHTILDVSNFEDDLDVGDILSFSLDYSSMLRGFTSQYVNIEY